jgi:hypothetical protein
MLSRRSRASADPKKSDRRKFKLRHYRYLGNVGQNGFVMPTRGMSTMIHANTVFEDVGLGVI